MHVCVFPHGFKGQNAAESYRMPVSGRIPVAYGLIMGNRAPKRSVKGSDRFSALSGGLEGAGARILAARHGGTEKGVDRLFRV